MLVDEQTRGRLPPRAREEADRAESVAETLIGVDEAHAGPMPKSSDSRFGSRDVTALATFCQPTYVRRAINLTIENGTVTAAEVGWFPIAAERASWVSFLSAHSLSSSRTRDDSSPARPGPSHRRRRAAGPTAPPVLEHLDGPDSRRIQRRERQQPITLVTISADAQLANDNLAMVQHRGTCDPCAGDPNREHDQPPYRTPDGNTAAASLKWYADPVSSHAEAKLQWAVSSLESQPSAVAGHYRDHPPEPETLWKTRRACIRSHSGHYAPR